MYDWIQTTFQVSEGLAQGLALVISLAVVLVLFGLFIFIIKRLMGAGTPQTRGRQPRIAVMDSAVVDSRRRLLLVRRDNIEHLILVGGPSDVVVEQNIVRNAPLAAGQTRSGAYQTPQQAGAIKTPMAPGPDIPLTPEDNKAVPPPAPPAERVAVSVPAQPAPAPVKNTAIKSAAPSPAAPASDTSSQKSLVFGGKPRTAPGSPSAGGSSSHSTADKPQPSFTSKEPAKEKAAAPATASVSPTKTGVSTSPVNVEPPKPEATAPASEKRDTESAKKSNPLRSLTRSFSPKDRPSYGSGKISPPASGPAARAKTALVSPVEADTQPGRVEPKIGSAGLTGSIAIPSTDIKADTAPAQTDAASPSPAPSPADTNVDTAEKTSADLTNVMAESIEKELFAEPSQEGTIDQPDTKDTTQASEEKPAEPVAAKPASAQIDTQVKTDPEPPAKETAKTGDDTKPVEGASGSDPEADKGLGERNPIEAEMAKILDELGGQPKQ